MGVPSSLKPVHRPLVFALNGQRVELSSVDPATTLLSYIRTETRFKGPKRGCGEGSISNSMLLLASVLRFRHIQRANEFPIIAMSRICNNLSKNLRILTGTDDLCG